MGLFSVRSRLRAQPQVRHISAAHAYHGRHTVLHCVSARRCRAPLAHPPQPIYVVCRPEVLLQSADSDGYTSACDVWSLGVIAYMLVRGAASPCPADWGRLTAGPLPSPSPWQLSGTPPFRGKRDREVLEAVRRGKFSMSGPKWEHVSLEAKDFVRSLLVFNPAKRPTAEQALKLPWLQRSRAAKRPRPLDPAVVSSLREFGQLSAFKRAALEAIAFSMSAQSIRDLRAQFAGLDADSHGIVSVPQFCDVLARHGASREEAVAIFHSIDQAQTGGISYTEFLAASLGRRLLLSRERIRDAFQRMDVDGTGFITRANLKVLLGDEWSPEKVDAMMGEVDTKGDGRIDFDEFLAAFTREGWREAEDVAAMEPPTAGTASGAGATSGGGGSSAQTSTGDVRSSSALSNGGATPMSVASNQRFFSGSGAGAERAAAAPGTAAAAAASPPPAPPPRRHTAEGSELGTAGLFRLGDGGLAGGRGGGVAAGGRTGLTVRLLDKAAPAEPGGLAAADALLLVVPSAAAAAAVDSGAILADRTQSDDTALVGALRRRASRPPLPSTFASSQLGRCGIGAGQGSSPPRATAASVQRALSHAESRGGHGGSPPSGVLVAPVARFATGVSPLLPLALAPLPPEPHDLEVCLLSDAPHGSGGGPVSPLALAGASDKMALGR